MIPDGSTLLRQLKAKIPERRVLLAPAHWFFTHTFILPDKLDEKEWESFVELSLEGVSPFPLEQLAWGWVGHPGSQHVFVYATPWSRLHRQKIDHIEQFHQALPGFMSVYGDVFNRPTVRFICENSSLTALYYDANNPVPSKCLSRPITAEILSDEIILEARKKLQSELPEATGVEFEKGVWVGDGHTIGTDDQIDFTHRRIGNGTEANLTRTFPMSGRLLWAADIRDLSFAQTERKSRHQSKRLWQLLRASAATLAIMLLLQVILWGLSVWAGWRYNLIDHQEPMVMLIANKQTLANRLIQTAEQELKPFSMLELINPIRPASLYFKNTSSRAYNILELEGEAGDVNAVNQYADRLMAQPFIRDVVNNPRTQRGVTTFQMIITFRDVPDTVSTARSDIVADAVELEEQSEPQEDRVE